MLYTIRTRVLKLEERHVSRYISGFGDSATFQDVSIGWFLHLEGSYEALFLGMEKPGMQTGDEVKITLEKISN
jgi:hypothetical protein